jgi:hypothetical protein
MYEYLVYCCSSYVNVGRSACTANRVSRDALERYVIGKIVESFGLDAKRERIREAVRERFEALLGRAEGSGSEEIRRRIGEVERKAGLLVESISRENACFVDAKLTALRKEKERLEALLVEVERKEGTIEDIERAIEETVGLLEKLPGAVREGQAGLAKELLRSIASTTVGESPMGPPPIPPIRNPPGRKDLLKGGGISRPKWRPKRDQLCADSKTGGGPSQSPLYPVQSACRAIRAVHSPTTQRAVWPLVNSTAVVPAKLAKPADS